MQVSLRRLSWAAATLVIGLAACNMTGDVSPAPTQGGTDSPDRVDVRALALGRVDGPVIDSFDEEVELTPYDGTQDLADYDLVVFDGDGFTPAAIKDQGFINQAIQMNKWVLGVDLNEAHKREGLGYHLGFSSHGDSPGYLVRKGLVDGHPYVSVVDYPTEGVRDATSTQNLLAASKTRVVVTPDATATFVNDALKSLSGEDGISTQADPAPPEAPSDLLHAKFIHTQPLIYKLDPARKTKNSAQQSARVDLTTTFHVYLDNKDNPEGDFQWVIAEIEGNANPTSGTQTFANMAKDEKAWFQDQLTFDIEPGSDTDNLFAPMGSAPETENGKTTISSEVDVNIGFKAGNHGGAVDGEFGYHWGKEREISDWKVDNDSSGNKAAWNYRSGTPYDADSPYGCKASGFVGGNGFDWQCWPQDPNPLSKNALQFHAQAVWKTNKVSTDTVLFFSNLSHRMRDTYCTSDFAAMCLDATHTEALYLLQGLSLGYSINLGAVVPIPVKSITFNPNPAVAGQPVTGTITLEEPARTDTTIDLSSNSENATVKPTVIVPQGQVSADFQVLTNANDIDEGKSKTATITSFYAESFQVQLVVKNSGEAFVNPPTAAPLLDRNYFYACAGDGGKWAQGYQVRYAATFIGSDGRETGRGPWTAWMNNSPYMLPELQHVPTDPSGLAVARKVYRQFQADIGSTNPPDGVTLIETVNDNTTTTIFDRDTAGTPSVPCPN